MVDAPFASILSLLGFFKKQIPVFLALYSLEKVVFCWRVFNGITTRRGQNALKHPPRTAEGPHLWRDSFRVWNSVARILLFSGQIKDANTRLLLYLSQKVERKRRKKHHWTFLSSRLDVSRTAKIPEAHCLCKMSHFMENSAGLSRRTNYPLFSQILKRVCFSKTASIYVILRISTYFVPYSLFFLVHSPPVPPNFPFSVRYKKVF